MKYQKIVASVMIEVVATTKEASDSSLKSMLEQIKEDKGMHVAESHTEEAVKVENPPRGVKEAYTKIMELEMEFDSLKHTFNFIMKYGPSVLEIMEPKRYEAGLEEMQALLNDQMMLIHKFAQAGLGGLVFVPQKKSGQSKQTENKPDEADTKDETGK